MFRKRISVLLVLAVLALSVAGLAGSGALASDDSFSPAHESLLDQTTARSAKAAAIREATIQYFKTLPANNHYVQPNDLLKDLASNKYYILDIRKPEDFAKGRIKGAVNIPFAKIGENLDKLPKNKEIMVVCYGGMTASQTGALLKINGFKITILAGGMRAWTEGKLPVGQ
jgi:rhodanese-related sulfurtransferase